MDSIKGPCATDLRRWLGAVFFCAWMARITPAVAMIPGPPPTDDELAVFPYAVVAHCDSSPPVIVEDETHLNLVVESVIKGDLKPGVYPFLLRGEWRDTAKSDEVSYGWVPRRSSLLFLTSGSSAIGTDKTKYLTIARRWDSLQYADSGLAPYFRARFSTHPEAEVPRLLNSPNPYVIARILDYLCCTRPPQIIEPGCFDDFMAFAHDTYQREYQIDGVTYSRSQGLWSVFNHQQRDREGQPQYERAADVERLLVRSDPTVRLEATEAYALLAGPQCLPKMRELLRDKYEPVRAIAACALAYYHAASAAVDLQRAAKETKAPDLAICFIRELEQWHEPPASPALIEFLQDEKPPPMEPNYRIGIIDTDAQLPTDDIQRVLPDTPALEAQRALKSITGYRFPADAKSSLAAWKKVQAIRDPERRRTMLQAILGDDSIPVEGRLVELDGKLSVEISNRSAQSVVMERHPHVLYQLEWSSEQADGGYWWSRCYDLTAPPQALTPASFTKLAPGQKMSLLIGTRRELETHPDGYQPIPRTCSLAVIFNHTGKSVGLKAWIGKIPVAGTPWDLAKDRETAKASTQSKG